VILVRSFRIVLSLALACGISGCGVIQALSQPTFMYSANDGSNNAADTGSTCTSQTPITAFKTWTNHYTNNITNDVVLHWFTQPGQVGTIGIYTGVLAGSNYAQPTTDAINAWYTALNGRLPSGHFLRMSPVEDRLTYTSDLIQMSIDLNDLDPSGVAVTSFGTVNGPGSTNANGNESNSKDGFYLAGAQIVFNQFLVDNSEIYENPTALYRLSLHEIGHALGLNHNPEKASIMYPTSYDTTCYNYGDLPITQDTTTLINFYDPVVNSDEITNPVGRGGMPINIESRSRKLPMTAKPSQATLAVARPSVEKFMRSLSWIHGTSDGPVTVNYSNISMDTLVAGSTLVAHAHLLRSVVNPSRKRSAQAVVTHEFILDGVVSDFGPAVGDTPAKVGDHIAVDEQMAYEDVPYADDPPVKAGTEAVLFLRPVVGRRSRAAAGHRALQYTAPLVSKWTETKDGRIYASSNSRTMIARQSNGKTLSAALQGNRKRIAMVGVPASDPRSQILSQRGISVVNESQKFRINPFQVLVENARYDGAVTKNSF
jgi:hypothetical protein